MNELWDKLKGWWARIPTRRQPVVLVSLLLALVGIQATTSMARKSVTTDELMYIAVGYYHLKTGDYYLNMTNTPLMKVIGAWPLQFLGPDLPETDKNLAELTITEQWHYTQDFVFKNRVDADTMVFVARLPIVLMALILGYFVFRWSRELYGLGAAYFSLFLYSFSPNILAHARIAAQDFGLAFFMFLATYFFWEYMKKPRWWPLITCGVLTGCALLAKTSAIFLGPIFGCFVLICVLLKLDLGVDPHFPWVKEESSSQRWNQIITACFSFSIIGALTIFCLNLGYGFQGSFKPLPLPGAFVQMLKEQTGTVSSLGNVFMAGKIFPNSPWFTTPFSYLVKIPIPTLIFVGAALVSLAMTWRKMRAEWLMLIYVGIMVFAFTFVIRSAVGLRYTISILPFLFILTGAMWKAPWGKLGRRETWAAGALAVWYLASSLSIHPHYLAYFNILAGGPSNGHKVLVDSNLDWGQDLKLLSKYVEDQGWEEINLGYFGSGDAGYYKIPYRYLPSVGLRPSEPGQKWWYEVMDPAPPIELKPGVYAVSATLRASPAFMTNAYRDAYEPFRKRKPDAQIGHSILIYIVEDEEVPAEIAKNAQTGGKAP